MDGPWHYRQAERMLWIVGPDSDAQPTKEETGLLLWSAATHATLALTAAVLEQSQTVVSSRWRDVLARLQPKPPVQPEGEEDSPTVRAFKRRRK